MRVTKVLKSSLKSAVAAVTPARRGRPPGRRTAKTRVTAVVKRGRGRPKSPLVQKRKTQKERELKLKLRGQIKDAKALVKSVKTELKAVLKREKHLKKLFFSQQSSISRYLQRWHARQIKKLDKQPRKTGRRKLRGA